MRLRRSTIVVAAVAALASMSTLSACGSSDDNTSSTGSGPSSSPDTSSAGTGDAGSSDSGSGGSDGSSGSDVDALTARTIGAAMAKAAVDAGSTHMVMSTSGPSGAANMSADMAGLGKSLADFQMGMKMTIPGTGKAELRIVDSAFYMKIPNLPSGSKPWVKIPLDDPNNPLGNIYSQLVTFSNPDAIEAQFSAFTKFTDQGVETVDGVEARHYHVTVDTAKSLKAAGLDRIAGLPVKDLVKSMPKKTTSDLWIDADNQLVKMSSGPSSGPTFEIHYSQWGSPVHVSAPPASQVQPMPTF